MKNLRAALVVAQVDVVTLEEEPLHCCRVYELYTSATGLYLCLVIAKGGLMLASWIRQVKILFVISIDVVIL